MLFCWCLAARAMVTAMMHGGAGVLARALADEEAA